MEELRPLTIANLRTSYNEARALRVSLAHEIHDLQHELSEVYRVTFKEWPPIAERRELIEALSTALAANKRAYAHVCARVDEIERKFPDLTH